MGPPSELSAFYEQVAAVVPQKAGTQAAELEAADSDSDSEADGEEAGGEPAARAAVVTDLNEGCIAAPIPSAQVAAEVAASDAAATSQAAPPSVGTQSGVQGTRSSNRVGARRRLTKQTEPLMDISNVQVRTADCCFPCRALVHGLESVTHPDSSCRN